MNSPSPGTLAQIACLLELTARKPGNVHRSADFDDAHFLDFALSAAAIGPAFDRSIGRGVGAMVLEAIEATRGVSRSNTNLGMVLLLAPLAAVPIGEDLREGVARVAESTTLEDARLVYRAIRAANPGGLGSVEDQDVSGEPEVSLVEAMRLASNRDLIARQYANGFREVFEDALGPLREAIGRGEPIEAAILRAHLTTMARNPDTLIERKRGRDVARESARRAREVLDRGGPVGENARGNLAGLDDWLRADGHARNPGASADVVAAALFAALRDGTIGLPLDSSRWDSEHFP